MKVPWLCRLGVHTGTYTDSAMFTSAERCGRCGEWTDPGVGAHVDRERRLWGKYPDDMGALAIAFARGEDA